MEPPALVPAITTLRSHGYRLELESRAVGELDQG
jgi:hypothetical protein